MVKRNQKKNFDYRFEVLIEEALIRYTCHVALLRNSSAPHHQKGLPKGGAKNWFCLPNCWLTFNESNESKGKDYPPPKKAAPQTHGKKETKEVNK